MRKTSQDGGDSTSITSGIENEIKKPGAIIKNKRNSIKRKVQNFSHESDDAVIEPLLQKDKEKPDTIKQSAKFNILSKTKTDVSERGSDKDKLISDDKLQKSGLSNASDITDRIVPTSNVKENSISKFTSSNAPLHNHMNTNVFSSHDDLKGYVASKSQILVEIDGSRQVGYNPCPLIFTTAKIHTDGKTKQMEPVQMTPVPILSTIEVSIMKSANNTGEISGQVSSNISTGYPNIPHNAKSITEQDLKPSLKTGINATTLQNKEADSKILISTEKKCITSNISDKISETSLSNKETKLTQPKSSPTGIKDNAKENKNMVKENEIGHRTITPTSHHANNLSSNKIKTTLPQEKQSGAVSGDTTKFTSTNHSVKESKMIDEPVTTITHKSDVLKFPEKKSDLNVIVKPYFQRIEACNIGKSADKDSKEKESINTNFNSKQLEHQNIVIDKESAIPKQKTNIVTSSPTSDVKSLNTYGEYQKSTNIEADKLIDKTKLTKHTANSVPTTIVTTLSENASMAENKISASVATSSTANKKTTITSSVAVSKIPDSVTKTAVINNSLDTVTSSVSSNKTSVALTTNSSTSKTFAPIKSTTTANYSSPTGKQVPLTVPTVINKSPTSINTSIAANKTSALINTPVTANKASAPSTTIVAGDKTSTPLTTMVTGSKTSNPVITATATKIPSFSTTTGAAVEKICTPTLAANSTGNPTTSSSSSSKLYTPITKAGTITTSSVPKPLIAEKYFDNASGNVNNSGKVKTGTTNENFREKSQVTSSLNTKPTSSTISTKSAKVSTMVTPVTTSQRTMVSKSPTIGKSTATKTVPQTSEITPKSLSSNEKPFAVKSNTTSISSTTTSGKSAAATVNSSTLVSSGSSSKSAETNKQNDSKSKELSNGSKSLKA